MPLHKKLFLFISLSGLAISSLFAQPIASFTANPTEGCVGEIVQFNNTSDISACSGTVSYEWDFDNEASSILENPTMTFTSSGSFNVSLTVNCSEGSDTYVFTVEILPTPAASFTTPLYSGCLPYQAQFTNTSTQGGGVIDNFYWTFGDGNSSTDENPTHTYNNPGNYSITLKATNENGCFDVYELQNAIQVSDTPTVSFVAVPQAFCQSPVEIFFDADVLVSPGLGYTAFWTFGDGGNGDQADMSHTYNNQGDFDVQLIITDDYGCQRIVDSLDYIHVHPIDPEYSILNSDFDEITNGIVCINQTTYFSCENEGYDVQWSFSTGQVINSTVANVVFNNTGNVDVTMTVDPGGDCEVIENFTVEIEAPNPSYTINPSDGFACEPPLEITFTPSTSSEIAEFHWLFGDGSDSFEENPSHTYTGYGDFQPVLEVTTVNGCVGTFTGDNIMIHAPSASFVADTTEGCIDLPVNVEYDTEADPSNITDFSWDFGDGSGVFSGSTVENHVYADTGVFQLTLTVTDINGCTATQSQEIQVGEHHNPLFDYSAFPEYVCPMDSLNFYSLSTDSIFIDDYEWLFGDTAQWQWGTEQQHHAEDYMFDQDTGWVQVVHVINHNGCRDSLYVDSLFYVSGPIIDGISNDHDCSAGNFYTLEVNLYEATEWDWIIKDEDSNVLDQFLNGTDSTLNYTFPGDGEYWVIVNATNSDTGCEYIDSVKVNVSQPEAIFGLVPASVCAGINYGFDGSASINAEQYYWDFGDGTNSGWSTDPTAQHSYNFVGDVDVTLIVKDANGCEDELTLTLHVVGPQITIDNEPIISCTPYTLHLTGNVSAEDQILLIEIEIGLWDTTMDVSALGLNFIPIDITRVFEDEGVFDLRVLARTANCPLGNTIIIEDFMSLTSIDAGFTSSTQGTCIDTEIDFTPSTNNPQYTYSWDFGDGDTSFEITPTHSYDTHGEFTVSLEISDALSGCVDTEILTDYIEIQQAVADFTVVPTTAACPPLQPDITNNGLALYNTTYQWNSGDNETSSEFEPDFTYNHAGVFTLHLIAETEYGCTAEAEEILTVSGPSGEMLVSDNEVCLNDTIHFEIINGNGIDVINWTFGDGGSASGPETSHAYTYMPGTGNTRTVVATLTGGVCDVQYETVISIFDVQAIFQITDSETGLPTDTFACSPMHINLMDASTGENLTYNWTIEGFPNDITTQNVENLNIANNTQQDSIVDVSLTIENSLVGCIDDTTAQLVIGYIPIPNASNDTIICENDAINLYAEGGGTYLWYPGLYLSDTEVANPLTQPEEDMVYYVTVTGENGCANTDSVEIILQHPVVTSLSQLSDSIVIGESTVITVTTDQENAGLSWTPDISSISCLDCDNPIFNPEETTNYYLAVTDSLGCFTENFTVNIYVIMTYTLDVPKAFTPEGNEPNRIVYARGQGIKHLREFSIYNRWGEKVFTTDDINQGWDGYYKGKLQAVDTYVYYVEAEMFDGSIRNKKGDILLMQ
jgi:gliding motility-associated-like protein